MNLGCIIMKNDVKVTFRYNDFTHSVVARLRYIVIPLEWSLWFMFALVN